MTVTCWVRVTIIGVFDYLLPRWIVDAAAAVLQAILAVALPEDWLSGSLRMCLSSILRWQGLCRSLALTGS